MASNLSNQDLEEKGDSVEYSCNKEHGATRKDSIQLYTTQALQVLQGITLAALEGSSHQQHAIDHNLKTDSDEQQKDGIMYIVSDKMQCSYCNIFFTERDNQKAHYKSDWHRFNLKQRLKAREAVTQDQFEELVGGDVSSISGSDPEPDLSDSETESACLSHKGAPLTGDSADDDEARLHIEGAGRRHPKIFLRNQNGELISFYRCVLYGKKNAPGSREELLSMARSVPGQMKWAILTTAGGHFAAAVFDKEEMVVHKTFHRYVIRAKRGTVQSSRDKQGNAPHSGGASLRRYNEAALTQEIQDLIESWSLHLKSCDRIFVRFPSYNKGIYYGGKNSPISKQEPKLRTIPFPTRRPTLKEVRRIHTLLTAIDCYGTEGSISDHIKQSPKKQLITKLKVKPQARAKVETIPGDFEDSDSEEEDRGHCDLVAQDQVINLSGHQQFEATEKPRRRQKKKKSKNDLVSSGKVGDIEYIESEGVKKLRNELYTACKVGDIKNLSKLLKAKSTENPQEESDVREQSLENKSIDGSGFVGQVTIAMLNEPIGEQHRTLLHLAAASGHCEAISLLLSHGSDPALQDWKGQTPYLVATDKSVRNEFRRFVADHPHKYNYALAQIPGPLTAEMEAEKKARETERKKAQKRAKKDRLKDKKEEEMKQAEEEREKKRYLALSDREKRALAAERRLTAQMVYQDQKVPVLSRCYQCGNDMTGQVPFEYMDFKFCKTKCLKEHRMSKSAKLQS